MFTMNSDETHPTLVIGPSAAPPRSVEYRASQARTQKRRKLSGYLAAIAPND